MRHRRQRIDEEDQTVDHAFGNQRTDLLVAAERAAAHAPYLETGACLDDPLAGGAGGDQAAAFERLAMRRNESDQIVFLLVMGDQREAQGLAQGGQSVSA